MQLIDNGFRERYLRWTIIAPVEAMFDNHALGYARCAVLVIAFGVITACNVVREDGSLPIEVARDGLGIGIDEQLVRVEALSLFGLPWTLDAKSIELSRLDAEDESVPDKGRALTQGDAVNLLT